jgi:hypothetical protein
LKTSSHKAVSDKLRQIRIAIVREINSIRAFECLKV